MQAGSFEELLGSAQFEFFILFLICVCGGGGGGVEENSPIE